ncbi:MAG: ASCH domain-containing protein [Chloroflexota bacterium]|nr:ASCH domain-containing protein [Chloroflexota bacterium]
MLGLGRIGRRHPLKTLTLSQPWASLVASGAKSYETRSWATPYRGPLAIHAGKGLAGMTEAAYRDLCRQEPFRAALKASGFLAPGDLPRGCVIATCRLLECVPITAPELPPAGRRHTVTQGGDPTTEVAFGHYTPGRWAWLLGEVEHLAVPVPARGSLGLWEWRPPIGEEAGASPSRVDE